MSGECQICGEHCLDCKCNGTKKMTVQPTNPLFYQVWGHLIPPTQSEKKESEEEPTWSKAYKEKQNGITPQ